MSARRDLVAQTLRKNRSLLPELIQIVSRYVPLEFVCNHNWDANGLLFWLGSNRGTRPFDFVNPAKLGLVQVSMSSLDAYSTREPHHWVDHKPPVLRYLYTEDKPGGWMKIDLGSGVSICPTAYMLQHDEYELGQLRNWRFEASHDDERWTVLCEHCDDSSLTAGQKGSIATWRLRPEGCRDYFRYLRIFQTGAGALTSRHELHCRGIELYGSVSA
jgi:hypothetical protein